MSFKFKKNKLAKNLFNGWLKKVDFVKVLEKIANHEPGKSYVLQHPLEKPAFEDQQQVANLAVELAVSALEGANISRKELEGQVNLISCRYDVDLHKMLRSAAYNIISLLFESSSYNHLFTSSDQREFKYLNKLLEAKASGKGVVYLINHSSHWDEFLFDTFLDQNNLGLPLFAAGQNMMITPSLTKIFMLGSYVILRKGSSRAYLSALYHYCQALSESGKGQGIFLEAWSGGARTRDGSLRYPRRLIALQGALAARNDVYVQPVVISYSRVPEDLGLSENRGLYSWLNSHKIFSKVLQKPWEPMLSAANGLKNIYGRTYIGFGEGKNLSQLRLEHQDSQSDLTLDEYAALYAMKEIARDKKIMASSLVARAISISQNTKSLPDSLNMAIDEINEYHLKTFGVEPDYEDFIKNNSSEDILNDGLNSLRKRKIIGSNFLPLKSSFKILSPHGLAYYSTHADRRLYSPSAKENIVVCGAGPWSYGVVSLLGRHTLADKKYNNSSLTLYDPDEEAINKLAYERTLSEYFEEYRLPKNVFPTTDHTAAFRKATEVIVATQPHKVEETLKTIFASTSDLKSLIIASRGFDSQSHRLTMQIAWEVSVAQGRKDTNIMALSGPFSPADLVSDSGGSWILAGTMPEDGRVPEAGLFKWGNFKVSLSSDPIGVQMAAALSDAYTLYGACLYRSKQLDLNTSFISFISEISAEAKALALALGGNSKTFEADSPAWIPEILSAAMKVPKTHSIKLATLKDISFFKDYVNDASQDLWPDRGISGYYTIQSAYLTAKHLGLKLPHIEEANKIFWSTQF